MDAVFTDLVGAYSRHSLLSCPSCIHFLLGFLQIDTCFLEKLKTEKHVPADVAVRCVGANVVDEDTVSAAVSSQRSSMVICQSQLRVCTSCRLTATVFFCLSRILPWHCARWHDRLRFCAALLKRVKPCLAVVFLAGRSACTWFFMSCTRTSTYNVLSARRACRIRDISEDSNARTIGLTATRLPFCRT